MCWFLPHSQYRHVDSCILMCVIKKNDYKYKIKILKAYQNKVKRIYLLVFTTFTIQAFLFIYLYITVQYTIVSYHYNSMFLFV